MMESTCNKSGKIHVLIFPAGAENRMDIYDSLRRNRDLEVYGASSKIDHAKSIYPADRYFIGKLNIAEEDFLENFNSLIKRFSIDLIIPTHDTVAVALTRLADQIQAGIVCSPYETARIAENKRLTAEALTHADYYPRFYDSPEEVEEYPIFLKPFIGAGSRNTFVVKDSAELEGILELNRDMLICEYLPGDEYTVGCFTNREGHLLFAGASTRERILAGRAYHSQLAGNQEKFQAIADDLNKRFVFRGAWFFQVKEDRKGQLKLMEFSVRQIGEMALYRQLGVNFAALSVYDSMGQDVEILCNNLDLRLDLRFTNYYSFPHQYERVYLDGDAFIRGDGQMDSETIQFAYQALGRGQKIVLIVPGGEPVSQWLGRYPIHPDLFCQAIDSFSENQWISQIQQEQSIFVSPSLKRRKLVKEQRGIPVFDLDGMECLICSADDQRRDL